MVAVFSVAIAVCAVAYAVEYPYQRADKTTSVPNFYQTKIDYNATGPIYIGIADAGVSNASDGWFITNITYTGTNVTAIKHGTGAWDNRNTTVTYR